MEDGTFVATPWKFERINRGQCATAQNTKQMEANAIEASNNPTTLNNNAPVKIEYIGTIEVVVLRCFPSTKDLPPRTPHTVQALEQGQKVSLHKVDAITEAAKRLSADDQEAFIMGDIFDGAGDSPCKDHAVNFGMDGTWEDYSSNQGAHQGTPSAGQQRWGVRMTGPNTGIYQPLGPTAEQKESHKNTSHGSPFVTPLGTPRVSTPPKGSAAQAVVINGIA